MPETKSIQDGTEHTDEDPEYMTIEDDEQGAFDKMWENE